MVFQSNDSGHLQCEDVASYVDGMLSPAKVASVEEHLASCALCRTEVVEVRRLVHHPQARRRPWGLLAPATAALAAGLGALLLFRSAGELTGPAEPVTRGGVPGIEVEGERSAIAAVAPSGTVGPDGVAFMWHAAAPDALYQVSLTAEDGSRVWRGSTEDTTLILPASIKLEPSTVYFWHVDALLPDGRSVTTGVQRFAVGP